MTKTEWLEWQKQIIREEYKDITPARGNAERQIRNTLKRTLPKVMRNVN